LFAVAESVPDSAVRDRINQFLALALLPSEVASQFGASGWVLDSVPLALYCAQPIAEKPLSVVLAQTIEVGGDTDTIASITGQIAGTAAGVPPDYAGHFSRITAGDEIIRVAEGFADFLSTRPTPE
jgi:ADP-ribosyl-[dinitrogen reductase] hydrolase